MTELCWKLWERNLTWGHHARLRQSADEGRGKGVLPLWSCALGRLMFVRVTNQPAGCRSVCRTSVLQPVRIILFSFFSPCPPTETQERGLWQMIGWKKGVFLQQPYGILGPRLIRQEFSPEPNSPQNDHKADIFDKFYRRRAQSCTSAWMWVLMVSISHAYCGTNGLIFHISCSKFA